MDREIVEQLDPVKYCEENFPETTGEFIKLQESDYNFL